MKTTMSEIQEFDDIACKMSLHKQTCPQKKKKLASLLLMIEFGTVRNDTTSKLYIDFK